MSGAESGDDREIVARELLRALRGSRSQVGFSRWLGYRSNVAFTWESGRRFPTVDGFFHAIRRTGGDPSAAIHRFLGPAGATGVDDAAGLAAALDGLRGATSVSEVARRMSRPRAVVARWLAGLAQPRLPDLLRLVDALTGRELDFVAVFVDPARLPAAAERWSRLQGARALYRATPWASAVLLALELDGYRALRSHVEGWIARRLGIPAELEAESLAVLASAGQIRLHRGKWGPTSVATVDAREPGDRTGTPLRVFWAEVARQRIEAGTPGLLAWNLCAVSHADLARIEDVQRRAFREIRAIVAASAPSEEVALLSWALLPLESARTSRGTPPPGGGPGVDRNRDTV